VARQISDAGVNIHFVYGSPVRGKMTVIFKTANNKKALQAMKK
jgi:hypothetical protein